MAKSRYPRVGHRLAPMALREMLEAPLPAKFCNGDDANLPQRLCDLDETAWKRFSEETCQELAAVVIKAIGGAARAPMPIGDRHIPSIPKGMTLADLDLEVRTLNCLVAAGIHERPQDLQTMTIEGILELKGFWVKSLIDLLTALEYVTDHPKAQKALQTDSVIAIKDLQASHRYPRPGHRLAPQTLKEVLLERLPANLVRGTSFSDRRLCDLDETAWDELSSDAISQLAGLIVMRLARVVNYPALLERHLPRPPEGIQLEELRLENRTHRCLERQRLDYHPESLSQWTVGQLLSIKAFGSKCLVDLLSSLETQVAKEGKLDESLTAEAEAFGKLRKARKIQFTDPRLGGLLRAIDTESNTIPEMVDRLVKRRLDPPDPVRLKQQLSELREKIDQLGDIPLEEELIQIFTPGSGGRDRDIVAQYFGWDGQDGRTLEELGQKYGLSRERIRQVCMRAVKRNRDTMVFAPVLDRAMAFLLARFPIGLDHLQGEFNATGISPRGLSIGSIRQAAEFLSRNPQFEIVEVGSSHMAVLPKQAELPRAICQAAKQVVTNYGAAKLGEVVAELATRHSMKIDQSLIRKTLDTQDEFCWLDDRQIWFRQKTLPQYGLPNMIEKILSVAERIDVSKLRTAMARYRRNDRELPPPITLLAFCLQMPNVRSEGKIVISDPPRDWRKVLTGVERCMVEVLKKHGPVMERTAFEDECVEKGMNPFSFNAIVMSSPVIAQYGRSVYGLLGLKVDPKVVRELAQKRSESPSSRVLCGFGETRDGQIYLAYQLSKAAISGGVITVPAAVKRQVRGKFSLRIDGGHEVGTLVAKRGCGWGLGPALRGSEAEQGDHMLLLFDTVKRQARIHIGDESILENVIEA